MVEYDNLLHSLQLVSQQLLDFAIVAISDCFIVCEQLLLRRPVIDSKASIVCVEVLLLTTQVLNISLVRSESEAFSWAIDFSPRLHEWL